MITRSDIWSYIKSIAKLNIFNSIPNSLAKETYFLARNSYLKSLLTGLQNKQCFILIMMTRSDIWSHIKSIANLHIFNSIPNSLAKETYFPARKDKKGY